MDYTTLVRDAFAPSLFDATTLFLYDHFGLLLLVSILLLAAIWCVAENSWQPSMPDWLLPAGLLAAIISSVTVLVVGLTLANGGITTYPATVEVARFVDDCGFQRVDVAHDAVKDDRDRVTLSCRRGGHEVFGQTVSVVDDTSAPLSILVRFDEMVRERTDLALIDR